MTCATIAALAGAVVTMAGGDTLALAPHPVAAAQLCYENALQQTTPGTYRLLMGDLSVTVEIELGGDGPERITILPPTGYMVFPVDWQVAEVEDGASVTVQIILGMM